MGAAHINESSCIEALKHELARARTCRGCKGEVKLAACPRCAAAAFSKGVVSQGAQAAAARLLEWLQSGSAEGAGGGKHFEP